MENNQVILKLNKLFKEQNVRFSLKRNKDEHFENRKECNSTEGYLFIRFTEAPNKLINLPVIQID